MADDSPRSREERERVESRLLESLVQRQRQWMGAGDRDRETARERFLSELQSFASVILDGARPLHRSRPHAARRR